MYEEEASADPGAQVVQRLGDDDAEDSVRAAAFLIHVGRGHRSRLVSL